MKRLIMIGTADSCYKVPYDNNDFDIWAVGTAAAINSIPRLDAVFELHTRKTIEWLIDERKCLYNRFGCPVFVRDYTESQDLIQNANPFPKDEILKHFEYLSLKKGYFNSTLAWMMAFAIMKGYEEITLMQIHLSHESEYFYERPCLEFWIAIAKEKGIIVNVPPDSDVLNHHYLYGFEEQPESWQRIRSKRLFHERQKREALADMLNLNSIINQFDAMRGILNIIDKPEKLKEVRVQVDDFFENKMNKFQTDFNSARQTYDEAQGASEMVDYFEQQGR